MPDQTPQIQGSMAGSSPALGQIAGTVLGLATANFQDSRQKQMNEAYLKTSEEYNRRMADYNQELALDMWNKTGYAAQRRQMEEAGINPGLMYGSAGSGGSTQGARAEAPQGTSNVSSGEIGMGMQLAMQMAMMKAQKENIEADTAKTKAETPAVETGRQKTLQETLNLVTTGELLSLEKDLKEIEKNVNESTAFELIKQAAYAAWDAEGKARSSQAKANIDEKTKEETIQQIRQTTTEQQVRIAAMKMGTALDAKKIEELSTIIRKTLNDNEREWQMMGYKDRDLRIREKANEIVKQQTDFNTGGAAQTKQWVDIVTQMLTLGLSAPKPAPNKIGF